MRVENELRRYGENTCANLVCARRIVQRRKLTDNHKDQYWEIVVCFETRSDCEQLCKGRSGTGAVCNVERPMEIDRAAAEKSMGISLV